MPTVEIRIPISANEKFLRMVHYFLESIQQFGGPISRTASCVVSVSRDEPYRDLSSECPWIAKYPVEFQWIENELFEKYCYDGTGLHRLNIKSEADIVILADADLLMVNDFDQVILEAHNTQKLLGFIAHVSPFDTPGLRDIPSRVWWNRIFEEAELPFVPFNHIHTGWGLMSKDNRHRSCPDYFNYGFIVGPRVFFERMANTFIAELNAVDRVIDTWFKSQIANTLCFARHDIPCGTLSINYNFPLHVPDYKIRALNPDFNGANSVEDVSIFHYLGNGEFNKEDFATLNILENALQRKDLSAAGNVFRRKLLEIHDRIMKGFV